MSEINPNTDAMFERRFVGKFAGPHMLMSSVASRDWRLVVLEGIAMSVGICTRGRERVGKLVLVGARGIVCRHRKSF